MPVVRGRNADRVDVVAGNNVFIFRGGDAFDIEAFLGILFINTGLGILEAGFVDVTDGNHMSAVAHEVAQ